jgi:enoyl-CoA hydratase
MFPKGLVSAAVPESKLDEEVERLALRVARVPKNQLMMQKIVINSAIANMGLQTTQTLATLFDGIARHSPEGIGFKRYAEKHGFKKAVELRDSGEEIRLNAKL